MNDEPGSRRAGESGIFFSDSPALRFPDSNKPPRFHTITNHPDWVLLGRGLYVFIERANDGAYLLPFSTASCVFE